jgi:hypothetical protein
VAGEHFAQNPSSFTTGRQLQQANAWEFQQSGIRLLFIPQRTPEGPGIKAQRDLSNIKTLRVRIVRVYPRQEQYPNFIHCVRNLNFRFCADPSICPICGSFDNVEA